ncbi:ParB/RepB/Spo0J family partition protein [Mediterraneibacter gnavus]|uniref:ParB/RepB/Spo0J family partition protein n=1 Tax=Mediterraneibacter gnavus TaxID=33038 RepID=UPI0035688CE3
MARKFNLKELLNQRSKEIEQAEGQEREKSAEGQAAAETAGELTEAEEEKLMMIDVYDLIPSKSNFYHVDDSLKRSIELVGVLQPLLVKKPENGKYRVIAGHRRRLAVLALMNEGKEERRFVPCVFKKEDLRDRLAIVMANRFREKTDWEKMMEAIEAEELAKELKTQYKLEGRTREVLSELLGVTEAQLGRYKSIYNNLIPTLMAEFKADNINISVAVELCGMSEEWQKTAAEKLEESKTLSLPEVKELKRREEEAKGVPGQMSFTEETQQNAQEATQPEENAEGEEIPEEDEETAAEGTGEPQEDICEVCEHNGECAGKKTHESGCLGYEPKEEYVDPQPEEIVSLCYSCTEYETCHEKKSTVTKCNAYNNRKEAQKTPEQRYNEEQDKIDRETQRKLREREQEQKMEQLPSQTEREVKTHEVKLASMFYDDVASGKKTFELRKNDRGYKVGDILHMLEFKNGKHTGRTIKADIVYMLEEYTGLAEDYCILGIKVTAFD